MEPSADLELARRMLAGDQRAFDEVFERCFPPLYRFALRRVGGAPDVAEEIAQATLVRGLTRLSAYRGEAALLTWLTAICRNQIADRYARMGRRPPEVELLEERPEVRAALESLAHSQDPQATVARLELAARVRLALDALPARYAEALEWKYLEECSVREIAERLSVGPKAAESLLTRARIAFKDAFSSFDEAGALT